MVKLLKRTSSSKALTFVEVIVTSVLMGIIFTGIMATMAITMKRISTTAQKENDEKQMDRFQVEMSHFIARSSEVTIRNASGDSADYGNTLICQLQPDPLEPTQITELEFTFLPNVTGDNSSLQVKVTASGQATPMTYTYSSRLESPDPWSDAPPSMFRRLPNGFIEYQWKLDSGFGSESFSNMAVPRTSL
jgi:hypothetical protein